jgi:hypothetical protein
MPLNSCKVRLNTFCFQDGTIPKSYCDPSQITIDPNPGVKDYYSYRINPALDTDNF